MDDIFKWFAEGGIGKIMEAVLAICAGITIIVGLTNKPTAIAKWATIYGWITKIFSFATHRDQAKTFKLPLQSASPGTVELVHPERHPETKI